jgi:hypothetical protein
VLLENRRHACCLCFVYLVFVYFVYLLHNTK